MSATTNERRDRYKDLVQEWDAAQADARKANRVFDRIHALATELKATPEGRRDLESLLADSSRALRLTAGSTCLEWAPDLARPALESLVVPRGTHSLSAEMTLREYDAGRLKFDR